MQNYLSINHPKHVERLFRAIASKDQIDALYQYIDDALPIEEKNDAAWIVYFLDLYSKESQKINQDRLDAEAALAKLNDSLKTSICKICEIENEMLTLIEERDDESSIFGLESLKASLDHKQYLTRVNEFVVTHEDINGIEVSLDESIFIHESIMCHPESFCHKISSNQPHEYGEDYAGQPVYCLMGAVKAGKMVRFIEQKALYKEISESIKALLPQISESEKALKETLGRSKHMELRHMLYQEHKLNSSWVNRVDSILKKLIPVAEKLHALGRSP
ncbi:MAG: hypothetical protein AB7E49_01475 [Campylobacterales bacterium]